METPTTVALPAVKPSVGLECGTAYMSNPATFWSSPEITIMKNVPFSKDGRRYVQLRLETYNMLNHHDWSGRAMGWVGIDAGGDATALGVHVAVAPVLERPTEDVGIELLGGLERGD